MGKSSPMPTPNFATLLSSQKTVAMMDTPNIIKYQSKRHSTEYTIETGV
jgi:hypothetical protein